MFDAIYPMGENSFWVFVLVTLILGGATAWATGRAIALTWRPRLQLVGYTLLLGLVVRFFQFALFHQPLLSLLPLIVDTTILLAIALLGYRWTRSGQMAAQYPWAFQRHSWLGWRVRAPS